MPATAAKDYANPQYEVDPFYWVPDYELTKALDRDVKYYLAFSKVTGVGNERTFICYMVPRGGIGDSANAILPKCTPAEQAALYAICASLTLDYVCRLKVGGVNINFFHTKQLPLPSPSVVAPSLPFIAHRVLELTYTSYSMKPFAEDLGYAGEPFAWDEDRRALLRAELDAKIAKLYGLTRDQLRYILDPTDVHGADYPSETFRVLKKNECDRFGEYRTRRLVLDAWDRLERGEI